MKYTEIELSGAYVIDLDPIVDDRGFFKRIWCEQVLRDEGLEYTFKQVNLSSCKKKATMRGLHYQISPFEEVKMLKCTKGAIFDVMIDLRKDSPTYRKWFGIELNESNNKMVYVPRFFAHGYLSLRDDSEVMYTSSEFYTPGSERGIRWDDPAFAIDWPITPEIVTEKDSGHPNYK
jgi:dTDP-4-dehydrorhamnose 3,5-epimerase